MAIILDFFSHTEDIQHHTNEGDREQRSIPGSYLMNAHIKLTARGCQYTLAELSAASLLLTT